MIKAIETRYKGYAFRSRLEARWAIFFDSIGQAWEYEVEGFDIGGMRYLPDFYLPYFQTYVEVKPRTNSHDKWDKAMAYAAETEINDGILGIEGDPWPREYKLLYFMKWRERKQIESDFLARCIHENEPGLFQEIALYVGITASVSDVVRSWPNADATLEPEFYRQFANQGICSIHPTYFSFCVTHNRLAIHGVCGSEDGKKCCAADTHPNLKSAFSAARSARFEHGESN